MVAKYQYTDPEDFRIRSMESSVDLMNGIERLWEVMSGEEREVFATTDLIGKPQENSQVLASYINAAGALGDARKSHGYEVEALRQIFAAGYGSLTSDRIMEAANSPWRDQAKKVWLATRTSQVGRQPAPVDHAIQDLYAGIKSISLDVDTYKQDRRYGEDDHRSHLVALIDALDEHVPQSRIHPALRKELDVVALMLEEISQPTEVPAGP